MPIPILILTFAAVSLINKKNKEILMNKTVSRFKKTFKIFGIKISESDEKYECVNMENVEPINPFIITEYEMENYKNQKDV